MITKYLQKHTPDSDDDQYSSFLTSVITNISLFKDLYHALICSKPPFFPQNISQLSIFNCESNISFPSFLKRENRHDLINNIIIIFLLSCWFVPIMDHSTSPLCFMLHVGFSLIFYSYPYL